VKTKITITLVTIFFLTFNGYSQLDTLYSVFEFESPSENDWGITYDGTDLWISDVDIGTVYKTSTTGIVLDSITIQGAMTKGIEVVNDTLWVLNSNIIGDTIINDLSYPLFSLYQIDDLSGLIHDSIIIVSPYTNLQSGDLWGLCYNSSKFYISFDGGYGPCLIEIDIINNTQKHLCCTHLSGLTSIEDSIWAIHYGKTIATTDKHETFFEYKINIYASDLVYDGSSFWVVNMNSNKIHQLEPVVVSLNEAIQTSSITKIYPNPASDYLQIKMDPIYVNNIELYDMQGYKKKTTILNKKTSEFQLDVSDVKNGIYILKINTEIRLFEEKIIINNNR